MTMQIDLEFVLMSACRMSRFRRDVGIVQETCLVPFSTRDARRFWGSAGSLVPDSARVCRIRRIHVQVPSYRDQCRPKLPDLRFRLLSFDSRLAPV